MPSQTSRAVQRMHGQIEKFADATSWVKRKPRHIKDDAQDKQLRRDFIAYVRSVKRDAMSSPDKTVKEAAIRTLAGLTVVSYLAAHDAGYVESGKGG